MGHGAKNNLKWFGILNGLFQMLVGGTEEKRKCQSSHG